MPEQSATIWDDVTGAIVKHRGLLLPLGAAALIFVVLVPLPPGLMDVLLAADIALAAIVLLTAIYVSSPLEFSVLPSVLLGATLFRLVLNVATTRLILTAGGDGRSIVEAQTAAGKVVWAFSEFVARGSLPVGAILFTILVVVQFVVVTKGAARISEVAARFVLDAMPGKQMAIDADLAAGLVTQADAQRRRERISNEADMYGAMDGASKFLRGDAVASVLIVFINVLGGLYVGVVQYGWDLGATVALFTRLTIGDGLVTQIPAFLISVAAALIVTRSTSRSNLGEEMVSQLISRPVVLAITAVFLGALALTSLPKVPLLTLGAGCITLALVLSRRKQGQAAAGGAEAPAEALPAQAAAAAQNQDVERLLGVDPMRVELGYALVRLVDPEQGGDLLERVAALRRQMALEMGFVVPPVRIRDNLGLDARGYVITVRGSKVASGRIYPNQLLAVAGEKTAGQMLGREATEPAFGTPAVWISPSQREQAERMNYTVVDPAGVVATHLAEVIRRHAQELLSRERVVLLLNNLRPTAGNLVEEVTARLKVGQVQKILRDLLGERVPIRDLEAILEALCQAAETTSDPELMYEHVRGQLARTLSQQYADQDGKLWCVSLDWPLEEAIHGHLSLSERPVATAASIPPELGRKVTGAITLAVASLRQHGRQPIVLCSSEVRPAIRQLIAASMPEAAVLAYNEVESVEVHSIQSVGIEL
jgi:flagellar biosynthesis protein FlhA